MEYYEKKISFLGENIQIIRKHRGMKQQELANKIGINMQSLSKIERGVNYKEMRGLDRYREQPKEYKYHDPYDDWIFRQLADIDNRNNIPNTSPQLDFNETDYEDYLKEKWNRGL